MNSDIFGFWWRRKAGPASYPLSPNGRLREVPTESGLPIFFENRMTTQIDACAPEGVVQLRDVCGVHGRRWGRDGCDGVGGRDRRRLWCGLWGHIVLILVLVLLVVLLVVCPASVVD